MFGKFGNFVDETKQELNKVTWPTRSELLQSTAVVITTTFLLAIFIGVFDSLLALVMRILLR